MTEKALPCLEQVGATVDDKSLDRVGEAYRLAQLMKIDARSSIRRRGLIDPLKS